MFLLKPFVNYNSNLFSVLYGYNTPLNVIPFFLLHNPQVVLRLKIEPKLRLELKIPLQPKGGISRYGPFAIHDLTDSVRRNHKISRKSIYADV
jgi:hypothetical protein